MLGNLFGPAGINSLFNRKARADAQQQARSAFIQEISPGLPSIMGGTPAGPSWKGGRPGALVAAPFASPVDRANTFGTIGDGGGDSWERALGRGDEIPLTVIPSGGESRGNVTTNPGDSSQFNPDPYPTVLPSLSAAQLGQLAERRRLADERLKQAEAEKDRRKGLLEASSIRAREEADRISRRSIQDFMRQAGGRGLARSPMVAGRQVRREGEDLRLKYGEIDTRLSTEVAALQDMVSRAASERDIAIAQIEQERVNMQADLDRLFPAAGMFR